MKKIIIESKGNYKDIYHNKHNWSAKIELEEINGEKHYVYKAKDNNLDAITINFYDDYLEMICSINTYNIYYENIIAVACTLGNKQFYIKEKNGIAGKFYFLYGDDEIMNEVKDILSQYPTFNVKKVNIGNIKQYISVAIAIIIGIILLFALIKPDNPKSKWSELTDEEREWYENNYGDGKMDDINEAIQDYKK